MASQGGRKPQLGRRLGLSVVAVGIGLAVIRFPIAIAAGAPLALGILGLVALVRRLFPSPDGPLGTGRVMWWTMVTFASHAVVGLAITALSTPLTFLRSDAEAYHSLATQIVDHWSGVQPLPFLPQGKEGFYYMLAGLYRLLGGNYQVSGLVVNAALGAALVPVITDLTRRLVGQQAARYVPPLVALLPGLLLWTSQLLKEAPVLFLIAVAANCAVRLTERTSVLALAGLVISVPLLFTFRGPVGLTVAVGLLAGVVLGKPQVLSGLGTGLTTLALMAFLIASLGVGQAGYRWAVNTDLQAANTVRQDLATSADTGFALDADISTARRALSFLPIGVAGVTLGPFPWQIRGVRQLAVLPDVILWWCLLPSLFRGLRAAGRAIGRQVFTLILPASTVVVVLALAVGNFGTVVRERNQLVVLVLPFIALGLALRRTGEDAEAAPEREAAHA